MVPAVQPPFETSSQAILKPEVAKTRRTINAVVVAGNPKPASRTADAGRRLAVAMGVDDIDLIDVVTLGAGLLEWGDAGVMAAMERVRSADLAIVASPTYKGAYTGLLKLFLDQFATGSGMQGIVAVPLMLGAGPGHQMAAELMLKPLLVELGAIVPAPALYQLDSGYKDDPKAVEWLERWGPIIRRFVTR